MLFEVNERLVSLAVWGLWLLWGRFGSYRVSPFVPVFEHTDRCDLSLCFVAFDRKEKSMLSNFVYREFLRHLYLCELLHSLNN